MKYMVSSRQDKETRAHADEIFLAARDIRELKDVTEKNSDKPIIVEFDSQLLDDYDMYDIGHNLDRYILSVASFDEKFLYYYNLYNFRFFYKYPVNNYYDFNSLKEYGVEYIKVTGDLLFDIDFLSKAKGDIKLRATPNVAYYNNIPRQQSQGMFGNWIRPEDVELYESAIDVLEFEDADIQKEKTLLNIYQQQKEWNGNLNLLITNFHINIDNKIIDDFNLGEKRINCRRKCISGGLCRACKNVLLFNKTILLSNQKL